MFLDLDEDGNGLLDKEEILSGMMELYDEDKAVTETERIFNIADLDQSGKLDFTEFKSAFVKKEMLLQEEKL